MEDRVKKTIIFLVTMAAVYGIFYFVGRQGWLSFLGEGSCWFYGVAIFLGVSMTFGIYYGLCDMFVGQGPDEPGSDA